MIAKHTKSKAYGADETIEELVEQLTFTVDTYDAPKNIRGYCASSEQDFEQVAMYVAQELNILPSDIHSVRLDYKKRGEFELHDLLQQLHYTNTSPTTKLVLVFGTEQRLYSYHGYDQFLVESFGNKFNENPPPTPKKMVVLTHIGHSYGKQRFNEKKENARRDSQFKQFYWEF